MSDAENISTTAQSQKENIIQGLLGATAEQIDVYLKNAHPVDGGTLLLRLPHERAAQAMESLDAQSNALLLREMHAASAAAVCELLNPARVATFLSEMAPDDRVDILYHLSSAFRDCVLQELGSTEAEQVGRLASYPADSAGGIMTTEAVALSESMSAEQAVAELRRVAREVEQIHYVYVVDTSARLTGVLSMRDLIFAPPQQQLRALKHADVVSVPVSMDQEEVARVLRRHRYLALPVVNDDGRLVGVITSDDLADVAEEEATEDIHKIGGTEALHAPYFDVGFAAMLRKRGGWLAILFFGEMLTASAMGFFEAQIQQAAMIALFVPLIISSGGNSGSQATTIIIRSLALREIMLRDWWRIAGRELRTGIVLGVLLGLIGALRIVLWYHLGWHEYGGHPYRMAATIWMSLVGVVAFGSLVGSMLPMIMHWLRLDPASASAPFVATLVDVTGLVIYFMIAIAVLRGTVL